MSERDVIRPEEEMTDAPRRLRLHERLFDGIRRASKTIHDKAIGAIDKVKAKKLREFPFKVDDVPEGKAGIDWVLKHRETVFPSVKTQPCGQRRHSTFPSRFT